MLTPSRRVPIVRNQSRSSPLHKERRFPNRGISQGNLGNSWRSRPKPTSSACHPEVRYLIATMEPADHVMYRAAIHSDTEAFEMVIRKMSRPLFAIAFVALHRAGRWPTNGERPHDRCGVGVSRALDHRARGLYRCGARSPSLSAASPAVMQRVRRGRRPRLQL